jgi:hypothetical protein
MKQLFFLIAFLSLSACSCKSSYLPDAFVVEKDDKNLNCKELIYAINETEFWIKAVEARCSQPHLFAKYLPCTPMVKLDAARNESILVDRVDYLRSLFRTKGCDQVITLKNVPIERQARILAKDLQRAEKRDEVIQLENRGLIMRDLPSN